MAQEAIRGRDEFLSIASHELKTPIMTLQLQIQGLPAKRGRCRRERRGSWTGTGTGPRVLLVEDDGDLREALTVVLSEEGCGGRYSPCPSV